MKSTHTRTVLAALLAVTLLGVGLALLVEPAEVAPAPAAARTPPDPTAELERGQAIHAYGVSLVLRSMYDIGVYQQALLEAELARQQAAARPRSRPYPGGTVGECTGFAIPDYIIQRESGGNPSAYNPSGAYGCAQTLLSHYSSGSCQGLDPHTIEGQRECVNRLSNGGQNLGPWSETR